MSLEDVVEHNHVEIKDFITGSWWKTYVPKLKKYVPETTVSTLSFLVFRTFLEFQTLPDMSVVESLQGNALTTTIFILASPLLIDLAKSEPKDEPFTVLGKEFSAKYRQTRKNIIAATTSFALKFGLYSTPLYTSTFDENLLTSFVVAGITYGLAATIYRLDSNKKFRNVAITALTASLIGLYASFSHAKSNDKNSIIEDEPSRIEYKLDSIDTNKLYSVN